MMIRQDINEEYKWDLTKIYGSKDLFNKDYEAVLKEINSFAILERSMLENSHSFYNVISKSYEIERALSKLYAYVNLLFDEDTSNNKNQQLRGNITNLYTKYNSISYFVVPNILKLNYSEIEEFYKEEEKLQDYEISLKNIFRYKDHTLSNNEEKILSSLSKTLGNNYETYELLKDLDLSFNKINVGKKKIEITNSNYSLYIESLNRNVRKQAFNTLYETYSKYKNTFASLYESNIKEEVTIAKIKKYNSAIEASLYQDELNIDIYNNLINTVNANLKYLYKYYDMKEKVLNVDKLHIYDVYAPLLKGKSKKYEYEIAKENVINALSILGDDYISILKSAFTNRWIDVYPNKSKRTGGYSSGSYDTYPYILLNYQDKYDDMSTLAHELGHSMHSYYTRTNNTYQDGDYTIFVAEVASTVNELILAKYMLNKSNNKKEKLFIINRLLELFRATIYRQTMFAEFEKETYSLVENDITLTSDLLCDKYYELNKKYFGKNVYIDEEIKYEWERIPHFYYNFYVYKYATGLSAACYIVENIIEKGKTDKYIDFLKCGRKKNPIDTLKLVEVDLTKREIIESALKMFNNLLNDFNNLYNDIYKM